MAVTAKGLREKQVVVESSMRQHRDRITADAYTYDAADEAVWTRLNDEHNGLTAQIRQIEQADTILNARNEGKDDLEKLRSVKKKRSHVADPSAPCDALERNAAVNGFLLRFIAGAVTLSASTRSAMVKARDQKIVYRDKRGLAIRLNRAVDLKAHQRALAFGAGAGNAGTLGPDGFINALEINMLAHGPMAQVCSIVRTDNGRPYSAPYADDTANEGVIVAEAASVATNADPTISEQIWSAYKITSKRVLFSSEAEEDSMFDLGTVLGEMLGVRLGRGQNRYMTTGTGTAQHEGVVIGSGLGVTAASATAFTSDELIQLEHSVDPAYRANASFMVHDTILSYIRRLKYTGSTEYIFNFSKGTNGTINGHQVQINNHMASALTTAQKLVLWGDFTKYILRQSGMLRVRRNVELHSDTDQESIQSFIRSDSKIQNSGTNPIKRLQLA